MSYCGANYPVRRRTTSMTILAVVAIVSIFGTIAKTTTYPIED
jgi:hypothetical protein